MLAQNHKFFSSLISVSFSVHSSRRFSCYLHILDSRTQSGDTVRRDLQAAAGSRREGKRAGLTAAWNASIFRFA